MKMTSDMYKRHEDMIQEERDRRINDLKSQLSQSEKDMEEMRGRHGDRVEHLESEWQREVERLKAMHSSVTQKLSEEHEHDLSRIRKIKEHEIESVNALQNHGLSLESLLSKWEKSAAHIEELHKNVISKQEDILKNKFTDIEVKNKRLDEVEVNWHSLVNELEVERSRCSDEQKKLYDTIEQQKQLIQSEQKRHFEERLELERDRKKLTEERLTFDAECNRLRDNMRKENDLLAEDRLKAKEEFTNLEMRRNEQNIKELDSQQNLNKERNEIKLLFRDIEEKRNTLHKEESAIHQMRISLQSEQHSLEQRKLMFDMEKVKMQELAQEIAKRAEELESLGEIALHEKREGHMAMDEAEKFRIELDSKLKFIENSFTKLREEEEKLNKLKVKVQQELDYIKETKDNYVCNLCSSGLNRVRMTGMTKNSIPDFTNLTPFYAPNQWSGVPDTDRALLIWQITGQQDAALLEQETAFINGIRTQTQTTTGYAYQQNDYFIDHNN
ncbi:unnamed protein product [Medioppia subpectinata]|uniref:Fas-binding factor 1 C-terminal domain-containing protein n=1 Tax=Medioppia subpectinata TaxID=1979941 RepID=A0A7R9KKE4_9ACAR|nr:unnamed protein product [Medioppia subpectinata]CAG2104852.1 unnamed protein product [Medioppia subpectinata]